MLKHQLEQLKACSCLDKKVTFKVKGSRTETYVVDEVAIIDHEYKHLLHRIELPPELRKRWGCRYLIRSAYYTLTAKTRKPVWGQCHAAVWEQVFRALMRKAMNKGWL
jgi:hypothetical protein